MNNVEREGRHWTIRNSQGPTIYQSGPVIAIGPEPNIGEEITVVPASELRKAVVSEQDRILALIREKAEDQDYATLCSWRALAADLEREWMQG